MGFVKNSSYNQNNNQQQTKAPAPAPPPPKQAITVSKNKPSHILKVKEGDSKESKLVRVGAMWPRRDKETGKELPGFCIELDEGVTLESTQKDRVKILCLTNDYEEKFKKDQ